MNKLKKNLEEYLESDCGDGTLLLIGKDEAELMLNVFKALDKACHVIDDLKDCTNIGSEIYRKCPFKEECNKGRFNGCIASIEKWKEWLLHD